MTGRMTSRATGVAVEMSAQMMATIDTVMTRSHGYENEIGTCVKSARWAEMDQPMSRPMQDPRKADESTRKSASYV